MVAGLGQLGCHYLGAIGSLVRVYLRVILQDLIQVASAVASVLRNDGLVEVLADGFGLERGESVLQLWRNLLRVRVHRIALPVVARYNIYLLLGFLLCSLPVLDLRQGFQPQVLSRRPKNLLRRVDLHLAKIYHATCVGQSLVKRSEGPNNRLVSSSLCRGLVSVDLGRFASAFGLDDSVFELYLGGRGSSLAQVHVPGRAFHGLERVEVVSSLGLQIDKFFLRSLLPRHVGGVALL